MGSTVNVNGRVFDQEHAVISIFDHGFLYGEGVYETLRTYNGQPFLIDRHMRRLRNSAGVLSLAGPLFDGGMGGGNVSTSVAVKATLACYVCIIKITTHS